MHNLITCVIALGVASTGLLGQTFPYSPAGDGAVHRYSYTLLHAKKKGTVLLTADVSQEGQKTTLEYSWIKTGPWEEPLDEEPIELSFDRTAIYFDYAQAFIDANDSNQYDPLRKTSGLLSHGDHYKIKNKDWGPWRKYLIVGSDGPTVLTISEQHGLLEWIDYMDINDYLRHDYIRKFTIIGTTKYRFKIDVSSGAG